jgi:polysaccharide export outer membrane protein
MKTSISFFLLFLLSTAPAIAQTPSPAPVPPVPQPDGSSRSTTAPAPATTLPTTAPAPATTAPSTTPPAAATRTAANSSDYRLVNGDKLRIEVYREPQLSHSLQIRPDGKISLPLAGDLVATGQTPAGLRDAITTALRDYVTNPVVTVIVVETQLPTISVMGEVNEPGSVPLKGPMTVIEALAAAGGFKDFANTKNITIRRPTAGGVQRIKFNYKEAVKADSEPLYVQAGDVIIVP